MVIQGPNPILCAIMALVGVVALFGAAGVACVVWAWAAGSTGRPDGAPGS